jgi:outer membrane lipoprotein-sorting protein
MNRKIAVALTCLIMFTAAGHAQLTPRAILERVDANMTMSTARVNAQMTITYRDGDVRNLTYEAWAQGTDESFLEFTAPARDAGSRFLRLEDAMWIFLPRVGKSVRIQGHMLRQGLMGSDFSYGDASENPSMVDDYDAVLEGEEEIDGRRAYIVNLTARRNDLAYQKRKVWVDAERWVPLKEERFARSGKLLKTALLSDVRRVGSRWYPFRIEMNDAMQTDTRTVLQMLEVELDVRVPREVFTLPYLEGGE